MRAVREHGGAVARVGITDNSIISVPFTSKPADIEAARNEFRRDNWLTLDAIYRGGYNPERLREAGPDAPVVENGDFDLISLPTDFFGLNLYSAKFVRADEEGRAQEMIFPQEYPTPATPWLKILPEVMYWGPRMAVETYGVSDIYITENGCG